MEQTIFYFSGTHWDREWYQPFQHFRVRLINVIDDLIEYMESNCDVPVFHFDGQTIVFDDYLEICPENKERLQKLFETKRVRIGPWYCMPDENLVSGEALIRNLQKGHASCQSWNCKPWQVGYICDIFGHTAQMPQIFRGFGIDAAVLGRGTNEHTTPAAFRWQSPDGSVVDVLKLPDKSGYGSFSMDVCGQAAKGAIAPPESDTFVSAMKTYIDHEISRANTPVVVVWDAMDHEPLHHNIAAYVKQIQKHYPDYTVCIEDLETAFDILKRHHHTMPVKVGELLETAKAPGLHLLLLTHTLSSRQSIKARNGHCQNLLQKTLEPSVLWFASNGIYFKQKLLDVAWEFLLQNHPHDSICGCSRDRVHEEMAFRFSQVESITEAVLCEGLTRLRSACAVISPTNNSVSIVNVSPFVREGVIRVTLPFSPEYPKWSEPTGYQKIACFRLYNAEGVELPYSVRRILTGKKVQAKSEELAIADMYEIDIPISLPALRASVVTVQPSEKPYRNFGRIAGNDGSLENDTIRVEIQPDGCISLYDKVNQTRYADLLGLLDSGEIGDGWNSVAPVENKVITNGRLLEVSVIHNSGISATVCVKKELLLPDCMSEKNGILCRSERSKQLQCCFYITLNASESMIHIDLEIDNNVCDHVLRLSLPTDIATKEYEANAAFCFVQRSTGRAEGTEEWKEPSKLEKPMSGIVLKRDEKGNGLAFVSREGLHECGADDDARGTLYITLLRSFSKTFTSNGEMGAQELFPHTYHFNLVSINAEVSNNQLQKIQDEMQTQVLTFVGDGIKDDTLFALEGDICVSSLRQDDKECILRIYNPSKKESWYKISSVQNFGISDCDLNDHRIGDIIQCGAIFEGCLPAYKMQTLRLSGLLNNNSIK